jgi:Tfp pilus assembly protein PilV
MWSMRDFSFMERVNSRRHQRGYALSEAMVGGAVLILAITGVMSALTQANAQVTKAVDQQTTARLAVQQLEQLRFLPLTHALWSPGTKDCELGPHPSRFTCSITVEDVSDTNMGGPISTPPSYRRAVVTVVYREVTSFSVETLKW